MSMRMNLEEVKEFCRKSARWSELREDGAWTPHMESYYGGFTRAAYHVYDFLDSRVIDGKKTIKSDDLTSFLGSLIIHQDCELTEPGVYEDREVNIVSHRLGMKEFYSRMMYIIMAGGKPTADLITL